MKAQTLIKQWLSSPAHRLAHVLLIAILGLGVLWWAMHGQTVKAQSDLMLSKDNGVDTIVPGQTLVYRVVVTNTGVDTSTGIRLTDILPDHTTFDIASDGGQEIIPGSGIVTWPDFDLAGNSSATRLLVITVNNPLTDSITAITNTVSLRDSYGHTVVASDTDSVEADPVFTLVKTSVFTTVSPGLTFSYIIAFTNTEPVVQLRVTDTLPVGLTFVDADLGGAESPPGSGIIIWEAVNVNANTNVTGLLTVTVNSTLPAGVELLVNTIQATDAAGNAAIDQHANSVDAAPDLALAKSDGGVTVEPGDILTYTLTYTNSGTQDATGVVIAESVPANTTFYTPTSSPGWSCPHNAPAGTPCTYSAGSLAAGDFGNVTFAVRVDTPLPAGVIDIENTASIADDGSNGADLQPVDNTDTTTTPVDAAPILAIDKSNDMDTVIPGQTLIYRIVITNTGDQAAAGIRITDTLPADTTFYLASDAGQETTPGSGVVTWPAFDLPGGGASATRLLAVVVDNPLPAGVTAITNTVTLRDEDDNTATAEDVDAVNANPVLTLDKTNAVTTTVTGATLSYTLTLTNHGDQEASGIRITDTLPTGVTFVDASDGGAPAAGSVVTWPAFSLTGGGASITRFLTVTVNPALPAGLDLLINTARASEDRGYTAMAQHATVVSAAPDLVLTKDDGGVTAQPGDTLIYTLTYTNVGDQNATGVVIVETVPAHTTFDSASSALGWTCLDGAPAGTPCTYPVGMLAVGDFGNIAFAVNVVNPLPANVTDIDNTASIADDGNNGADLDPADNTDTTTTPVDAAPDLVVSKDNNRTIVQPGETLSYRITITNTGNIAAMVAVTDTLPANTAFLVASDGGAESTPGVVTWPAFTLGGGGAAVTRLVVVTVGSPVPAGVDTITNTVTALAPGEIDLTRNTAQDIDTLSAAPNLRLDKSDGGVTVAPGDTLVYTLTYANIGVQGATGVIITETVPVHTTFNNAASTPGWACVGTTCTFAIGAVPAGDADAVQFAVDVNAAVPAGVTQIDNTASIADDGSNGADTNPANNTAATATPLSAAPDLEIGKSDGVDTVAPGDTLVYQLIVTNSGNQAATGINVSDNLPAYTTFGGASDGGAQSAPGIVTWPAFALDGGGASVTRAVTVAVATPFPVDTNVITNTATVTDDGANGSDPTPGNNTATDTDTVSAAPGLIMSKDNGITTVMPGSMLIYRLVITNTGNQLAAGIVLTDTLPEHTTFTLASHDGQETTPGSGIVVWPAFDLPGGRASRTRLLVVTVDTPLPAGVTTIENAATLRDNRGFSANAVDIDAVDANPDFILTKISAITTTTPGATFSYTIILTNTGNQDATGVVISDTLPADVAFAAASAGGSEMSPGIVVWPTFSLASGASATRYLTVTVNPTLPAGLELLINTVDVADDRGYRATNQHATFVDAAPNLILTKDDGGVTVQPGDTLIYTLTYTNAGNQDATGVVIAETVPAYTTFAGPGGWSCVATSCEYFVGALAAGETSSITFTVDVISPLPASVTAIENTAFIADDGSNGADTNPADNTDSTSTLAVAAPDLVVSKDDERTTVQPGDTLSYRITITNAGDQNAASVFVTDTLPLYTTFLAASDGGVETGPGVVTWPAFSLAGDGAYVTRLVVVTVNDPVPAGLETITNTVAVATPSDANIDDNIAWDADTIIAAPDLALTKRNGDVTVEPGDALLYTLTYANLGNQEATGIVITETVPVYTTFDPAASHPGWSCVGASCTYAAGGLPGGASRDITFTVNVDALLPTGVTQIVNAAGVADDGANGADTDPANNADSTVTPVIAAPDLTLTKSDGGVTTTPGATLVYTLTYANAGNQEAMGVAIAETVPAHTTFAGPGGWSCVDTSCTYDLGALPASASGNITFAVTVVTPLPASVTQIDNTASIADDGSNGADTNPADNTDTTTTPVVAAPDLVVSKDDARTTVQPGDTLSYRITITNTGHLEATAVFVTDTLPLHTTFVAASNGGAESAPGVVTWPAFNLAGDDAHVTRLVIVAVDNPLPTGVDAITNTVVTFTPNDANLDDNTAWDVDTVSAAPDLALTKRASNTTVEPGDVLAYTLNYANLGNQEATGVLITETVPAYTAFDPAASHPGWSCVGATCTYSVGSLPVGTTRSITFTVNIDISLPTGITQIENAAGIADDGANGADTDPANNTDSTVTPVIAAPDLTLTKSDGGVTTTPGATLVYTLTYANVGNQDATGVIITETIPAHTTFAGPAGWSCVDTRCEYDLGTLPASTSGNIAFAVTIVNPLPAGVTQIDNTASIADDGSNGADTTPADNTAGTATPITATPDLAVTKSDGVDTVEPGDTLVYQLVVTNNGDQAATGVRITDHLPAYTTFVGASDGGTQTTLGIITWPAFELPGGGASVTRAITVTVPDPFPADTNIITNTATVADDGANGPDPNPENNTATDVDTVFAMPNLQMSKDDGLTTVVPGSTIIYRLVITNTGRQLAAGIRLTDTLPAQTTFDIASDGGQETAPGSDVVVWPAFNLAGGDSTTRLLVASVDNPLPAGVTAITNTAALRDNRGTMAQAEDTDAVDANPLLFLDKTNAVETTVPGATLVYTLTLTNNGNQEATGVRITDTLPADVTFLTASDGGTEIEPGIVTWPAFDLAGGSASVTRFLVVRVNATLPAGVELLINTARAIEDRGYSAIAQHVDVVVAAPDLAIAKADGGIAPQPGEVLVYTLTYANVGEQGATGAVISETVPAYSTFDAAASSPGWTCLDGTPAGTSCTYAVNDLPANASGDIAFAVRVVSPLPVSVTQTGNTASIADDGSNGADTDPANNSASIITPLDATIDLLIMKDDGDITVEPGETIVYTLTYANNGDQIAGGVVITETVPALTTFNQIASSLGWTCVHGAPAGTVCTYALGDVIEGGTLLFAVDVVLPFPIEMSEITNQVVIGADANNIPDANPDDNMATAVTPIITRPDLVVGKDDRFSVVLPDQQVTYIITATNVGTQNATGVLIVDTLPDYVTFLGASHGGQQNSPGVVTWPGIPQLALDEIVTRTLTVIVDSTLPAGVLQITNTVTVSDDGTHGLDLNPDDNTATDVNIVGAMPDLILYKTVDHTAIYPNGPLIYTIRVENAGSRGATGVTIIDDLPPDVNFVSASDGGYESAPGVVTWPIITLDAGAEVVRTLTARTAAGLPEGLVLTNTATVSNDGLNGEDPAPDNNTDTASSVIEWPVVYLPLVLRRFAVGPDLVVDDIDYSNGTIAIIIRNQGEFAVDDTLGFWVDLYINPSPAPTHVNQTWDPISPYGAAWAVDREALPILPGESRILYLYDIYYSYNHSRLPEALKLGDIIYAQVDSYNSATTYGVVREDHEMNETEYNNIRREVVDTDTPLNPVTSMQRVPESPEANSIPERP